MTRRIDRFLFLSIAGVATVVGCGRDLAGPTTAGIRFIAGVSVGDTVGAQLRQALVVEVRGDGGALQAGEIVRFEALPISPDRPWQLGVYLSRLDQNVGVGFVVDTTDAQGRARALVRLGTVAGTGAVVVSAPAGGLVDTASYTIWPGAAAGAIVQPADSAVYVGNGYQLRAAAVDRFGNLRDDAASYLASSSAITVTGDGRLSASGIGRAYVVARAAAFADTAFVSVVPRGAIAGVGGVPAGLVMLNLDGSGYRVLTTNSGLGVSVPDWSSAGTELAFQISDYNSRLYAVDLSSNVRRIIQSLVELAAEYRPQYTRDGSWILFGGRPDWQNQALWRVRPDGSGAQQVGPSAGYYDVDAQPSPSPDGTRVAYVTNRDIYPGLALRVLNLSTGVVDTLRIPAETPRWSPVSEQIAYLSGGIIYVVRPDGTQQRQVSQAGRVYGPVLDWSPDGQWIVARGDQALELIEVQSGQTLPLAFTAALSQPAWRP